MTRRANETPNKAPVKNWLVSLCAALVLAGAASPAHAIGPIFDWDPAYFWVPGTFDNQPAGVEMKCVGTISAFGPPLEALNATMPATEYTFYIEGLISQGTVQDGSFYTTFYTGGTIAMYADATPDAVFTPDPANPTNTDVPETFVDGGAPFLTGTFTSLVVHTNSITTFKVGNIEGEIQWTGGTLFGEISGPGGQPCPGLFTGGATWNTVPGVGIPGYLFRHDGKIDLQCPTPTSKSTWGKLKSLYR